MIRDKDSAPTSPPAHVVAAIQLLAHHIASSAPKEGAIDPNINTAPAANVDPQANIDRYRTYNNLPAAGTPTDQYEHEHALNEFLPIFAHQQFLAHLSRAHDGMRQQTPTPPVFDYARFLQGLA